MNYIEPGRIYHDNGINSSDRIIKNPGGTLHAILINGIEGRHSHDIKHVYRTLRQTAGVPAKNITVFEHSGYKQREFPALPATKKELDKYVQALKKVISPSDEMLVFVTNHGELRPRVSR